MRRFFNALAWSYRQPIYDKLEIGGTNRGRICKNFINHGTGSLDTCNVPDVSNDQDKALALSLYRNALCVNSMSAAVVDLIRIFEIKLGSASKSIRGWINSQVQNLIETKWDDLKPHDLEAKRRVTELLAMNNDMDVGDYLYRTARCSSAHAATDPNDPFNPEHNDRLREDLCIVWYLVELFIEKVIGIPSPYRERTQLPSIYTCMKLSGFLDRDDTN